MALVLRVDNLVLVQLAWVGVLMVVALRVMTHPARAEPQGQTPALWKPVGRARASRKWKYSDSILQQHWAPSSSKVEPPAGPGSCSACRAHSTTPARAAARCDDHGAIVEGCDLGCELDVTQDRFPASAISSYHMKINKH